MNLKTKPDFGGICSILAAEGYTVKFRGFDAIDLYMGLSPLPCCRMETNADIAILARHVDDLRFPGVNIADAAADLPDKCLYFNCSEDEHSSHPLPILSFEWDWQSGHFRDHGGVYYLLKELKTKRAILLDQDLLTPEQIPDSHDANDTSIMKTGNYQIHGRFRTLMDASLLVSRYGYYQPDLEIILDNCFMDSVPEPEVQRTFLVNLMVSPRPDWGLEMIKKYDLLNEMWPELASYDYVDHAKEFHPEGNVWKHTLETFRHRKAPASGIHDLRLSLGLLLHDSGKPISDTNSGRRFDGHAELGAKASSRFLGNLGFEKSLIEDIYYLVRNHMLPAALKRLPLSKTSEIMASPLFPTLMELYRCDESSSFKGLDEYYENSSAYKAYLKNSRNPYRALMNNVRNSGRF